MRCYGSRLNKSCRTCTKHSSMETPTVQVAIKLHQNIRKITLILQKNHKGNTTRLTTRSTLESPVTLNILVFAPQDKHKPTKTWRTCKDLFSNPGPFCQPRRYHVFVLQIHHYSPALTSLHCPLIKEIPSNAIHKAVQLLHTLLRLKQVVGGVWGVCVRLHCFRGGG